jgi:hypothetical protein
MTRLNGGDYNRPSLESILWGGMVCSLKCILPTAETCKVTCYSCRRGGGDLKVAVTEVRSQVEKWLLGRA